MPQNQAALLEAVGKPVIVAPYEYPKPAPGQVIIRNHMVAINPVDFKLQDVGLWLKTFPAILGTDVSGEVVEVGDDVSRIKVGDRVSAAASQGFQLFSAARQEYVGLLPDSVNFEDAAVFPVAINTASKGLFDEYGAGLGLPYPSLDAKPTRKVVIVWGGSSSVGITAAQLAIAAGVTVFAVASAVNHALCREAGATQIFDYRAESVIEDIVTAVKESKLQFAGVFNAISTPETLKLTGPMIEALGGGLEVLLLPDTSGEQNEKVKRVWIHGGGDVTKPVWQDFFSDALRQGKLKPLPVPKIVGKGLESIQPALDLARKGVSAQKLIVDLTA